MFHFLSASIFRLEVLFVPFLVIRKTIIHVNMSVKKNSIVNTFIFHCKYRKFPCNFQFFLNYFAFTYELYKMAGWGKKRRVINERVEKHQAKYFVA